MATVTSVPDRVGREVPGQGAGVVDQHVESVVSRPELGRPGPDLVELAHVGHEVVDVDTGDGLCDWCDGPLGPLTAPGREHHRRRRGDPPPRRWPDPARRWPR